MKPRTHGNLKPMTRLILFLSACLLLIQPSGYSRDQIDSDQRLNILNRATGKEYTSNTFQARMDAIFDTTATPERTYVGTQDAIVREKAVAAKKETSDKELFQRTAPRPGKDVPKVKDTMVKLKTDMTEKNYQAEREKLRKENAEKMRQPRPLQEPKMPEKSAQTGSNVSLALKNNPFYRGNFSKGPEMNFEDQKSVMVSRLIQQSGMDQTDAERLVAQSSSPEDLTIKLMEEQGFTYQDAGEIAGT